MVSPASCPMRRVESLRAGVWLHACIKSAQLSTARNLSQAFGDRFGDYLELQGSYNQAMTVVINHL